jgi:hypothetical protein
MTSLEQKKALVRKLVEIMAACSWEELLDDWSRSAAVLAEALGRRVSTANVPGDLYSPSVGRAAAKASYTTADEAAEAATGRAVPWVRQGIAWAPRGAAKRIAGERYEGVRRARLARR